MTFLFVIGGVLLGCASIWAARRVRVERWAYAVALLLLPAIYVGFALLDDDGQAALLELAVGVPFIVGGIVCAWAGFRGAALVVGVLWILHGIFDLTHDQLFTNAGVPSWYPLACAGTDLAIGLYVLTTARAARDTAGPRTAASR